MAEVKQEELEGLKQGGDVSSSVEVVEGAVEESSQSTPIEKFANVRCVDMMSEWRHCIAAYHQFHQYYIHGHFSRCKEEKSRMYNCLRWRMFRDEVARSEMVKSLEEEQNKMKAPNSVWKLRDSPPSDWTR